VRITLAGSSLLLLLAACAADAQKADSVFLRNGDRITGEVKSLSKGLLKYSTDDLGTIYIEWDKVERISTRTVLEVQLSSGPKFYGPLGLSYPGTLALAADTLLLLDIVALAPIEQKLLARISGYLDLGFSFQKANSSTQLTTGARVAYRSPSTESAFEFSSFLEDREDATGTARLSSFFSNRFLFANRWSAGFLVGYDRNRELDLAGRGRLSVFGARVLAQSNHSELAATSGLVLTAEKYFSTDGTSGGFEGVVAGVYRAFRYDAPKLDASITSQAFPSFTIPGRVRLQNDVRVSYELVKDFMLTVTLFDTYDSKPQSADAPKNDFGTTLAISYTF
jgi:Protein of unknown function, DUF481